MINFRLDPKTHSIEFEINPKGEKEPIQFRINKYRLITKGDKFFIEVSNMTTNREWMNIAISNFLPDHRIELPAKFEKLIRLVM